MIGADVLLQCLIKEKVNIIFGYPGGVTIPLHDRITSYPQIKHVLPRHEQGAAMAADAYFRVTGRPGVCLSTSGPGATNLVSGIANAFMDSVGMVAITCQVATNFIGSDAFQEIDVTGVTQSITKQNYLVENVDDLPRIIKEAFYLASTGRPGPVHIDIPVDVLKAKVNNFIYPEKVNLPGYKVPTFANETNIKKAIELIKKSTRPVVMTGHGVIISRASFELKQFVENTEMPVISTLLGLGALPHKHPLNFGMLGMHGMAYANYAVHNADLIIGVGLRFDDRITGKIEEFARDTQVIHIDIDPAEIGKNTIVDVPLIGDCRHVLKQLNTKIKKLSHKEWLTQIKKWNEKTNLKIVKKQLRLHPSKHLLAADIIKEINHVAKKDCLITSDVGQNQMWTAQYFNYNYPGQLLSSGGLGCMGYSLPASVGAQMAEPTKQVWALMGDGGFQMNIQELGTIMQEKLPIKIILFHNGYLGMVRQWQELFYQKNYSATKLANPNFVQIAKAYNIEAHRVSNWTQAKKYITKANKSKKAIFLEFIIGPEDNVYPMVPPGNTLNETIIGK